jgi:hypothetical protein
LKARHPPQPASKAFETARLLESVNEAALITIPAEYFIGTEESVSQRKWTARPETGKNVTSSNLYKEL